MLSVSTWAALAWMLICFLDVSDLEDYVDAKLVVYLEHDVGGVELLESGDRDVYLVVPDWQRQKTIGAIVGRNRLLGEIGLRVRYRDACSLDHGLRRIAHDAKDGPGDIREQIPGATEQRHDDENWSEEPLTTSHHPISPGRQSSFDLPAQ